MEFENRTDAGRRLGERVAEIGYEEPVVVGMPRGGVPVAVEVARAAGAPLDIVVVRKVGAPDQPEFAIGAIAEDGITVSDYGGSASVGVGAAEMERLITREREVLERRTSVYRAECPRIDLAGRTAILVDDGLATGLTAAAAAQCLRRRGAVRVVLAVPVCTEDSLQATPDPAIDAVVCLTAPRRLFGVGYWYRDFSQVSDATVLELLREVRAQREDQPAATTVEELELRLDTGEGVHLEGTLAMPPDPAGVIVFAHGSGSSRLSPRNRMVAQLLNENGFATLLFDLLDPLEAGDRQKVFDIPLLGRRLLTATAAVRARPGLERLPLGYFGASTGAGAALWAAAERGEDIAAVVSRGGRPDLAGPSLERVSAATLLLVGGDDRPVITLNREAMARMSCTVELVVIGGAGHLFEEPGTLEQVADEACGWFARHLVNDAEPVTNM